MTGFLLLAALMIGAALAFVVVPLLRRSGASDSTARRARALDDALAAGIIDADEYARKRAALITAAPAPVPPRSRAAFVALLATALLLPGSALLLYRLVGTPQALDGVAAAAPGAQTSPHGDRGPQLEQAITMLAERLKKQPNDVEGWALLGRAYQTTGHADEAVGAFKRAHDLAPTNTALTAEYAQVLVAQSPQHLIEGEPLELLQGVLKADPQNQRALWLLGIRDYQAGRYPEAIARWNTLLALLPAGSEVAQSVQNQIADAEARRDGKTPPQMPVAAAAPKSTPAPATATTADASSPSLTVKVALDPKLADKLDKDATLFVFARAASGPPMPLAIQRLKAGALPTTVTLDDSMGMMPAMKLSKFPQVVVGARVSRSGNAMPQSGDLQTLSAPLDVHRKEPIVLTIDQQVP